MIALLVGTRPEIIKMAPVIRELQRQQVPFLFIHSNQHYSQEMDAVILRDLSLPKPDIHLGAGSGSHATQTAKIMMGVEEACIQHKPSWIVVHGDTNTTLAGALAAKKLHIPVAHIEAGLRSFDYSMPEEINRILTDRISDVMFAPTRAAQKNLIKEGLSRSAIVVTGNTVVDALRQHIGLTNTSNILNTVKIKPEKYVLVTAHRAENTDDRSAFDQLLILLNHVHKRTKLPLFWPVHPRVQSILTARKIKLPDYVIQTNPLGYIDMLTAMNNARLILTDSGGLQEEAYLLKKPLITMRTSTERPETLSANFIVGLDPAKFDKAWRAYQTNQVSWSDTLGKGNAAKKIVSFLKGKKPMKTNSVLVMGLGYIGLPTALLMAEQGIEVGGFDISEQRRKVLRKGELPFEENGLSELFTRVQQKNTFQVVDRVISSDFHLIAVPTPQVDGRADLTYIKQALEAIKPVFLPGQTIIVESTIGPRDCVDELIPMVAAWNKPFHFVHCPERAIPGNTLYEMVHNDRIIGGDTPVSAQKVVELYAQFVKGPIHLTNTVVAASCKVMENTYRAVNIALANEFAQLAEELDFNVWEAIDLANKHPRVHIHQPGPGVGGHCIPIDPWFFVGSSKKAKLIALALEKNEAMAEYIASEIDRAIKTKKIIKPVIAILGYAYKKNVDDARETPAEPLRKLLSAKFKVIVTDPLVKKPEIKAEKTALAAANVWVLATDHDHYRDLDLSEYPHVQYIYDTRNCFTPQQLSNFSGIYRTLGRKSS